MTLHTRETVNLYTAGAPWKEKLTVSGVGVVGSNPRFILYPNVFEVSFFSFLPVSKNPRMTDDGLMNKDHAFKKTCTKTYNLSTYRFSGLGNPGQNLCYGKKSDSIFRCSHPKFDLIASHYNRSQ